MQLTTLKIINMQTLHYLKQIKITYNCCITRSSHKYHQCFTDTLVFSLILEYSILQLCFDLPQKETTTNKSPMQRFKWKWKCTHGWSWGWCWRRPLHTCSWLSLCKVQRPSRRHHWVPKSQSTGSSRPRSRWSASCCPPQWSRPHGTKQPPALDWKFRFEFSF